MDSSNDGFATVRDSRDAGLEREDMLTDVGGAASAVSKRGGVGRVEGGGDAGGGGIEAGCEGAGAGSGEDYGAGGGGGGEVGEEVR